MSMIITDSGDRMSETTGTQWPDRATSSAACHPKSRDARFCDSGTHDFHGRVAAHVGFSIWCTMLAIQDWLGFGYHDLDLRFGFGGVLRLADPCFCDSEISDFGISESVWLGFWCF